MSDALQTKPAILIAEGLPPGLAANTAAVLALSLGRLQPDLIGPDLKDGDGSLHLGITTVPFPVLAVAADRLAEIRTEAMETDGDLVVIDFTDCAQRTRTYDEYSEQLGAATASGIAYVGLALLGARKSVQRLTGSLPLYR